MQQEEQVVLREGLHDPCRKQTWHCLLIAPEAAVPGVPRAQAILRFRAYGRWLGHHQARVWQAARFRMEEDRKEKRRQA